MIMIKREKEDSIALRISELNHNFQVLIAGDSPGFELEEGHDELSSLRNVVYEIYTKMKSEVLELEQKYQQLQLSYISLEEKYAQSYTFRFIQEQISRELNSNELLYKTLDVVMGVFGSRRSTIYMMDEVKNTLIAKAGLGLKSGDEYREEIPFAEDNLYVKCCLENKVLASVISDPLKQDEECQIMMVPLSARHNCLGLMVLELDRFRTVNEELIEFAGSIARELSMSLENAYLYDKMRNMAIRDGLTGTYNRMYLMDYMAELFAKNPKKVSIIILDLDHFKQVNDKFGHLIGDKVLKTTAKLVERNLPRGIIARYGGEEFVIVLPDTDQDDAFQIGDSIRRAVEEYEYLTDEGIRIPVTLSAGLANYPLISNTYEKMLQIADRALYEAKRNGRNRLCVAGTEMKVL
jgi:diguanylate cyclase (GGDEF)-like protein